MWPERVIEVVERQRHCWTALGAAYRGGLKVEDGEETTERKKDMASGWLVALLYKLSTSEEKSATHRAGDDHSERTCALNLCINLRKCSCTDGSFIRRPGCVSERGANNRPRVLTQGGRRGEWEGRRTRWPLTVSRCLRNKAFLHLQRHPWSTTITVPMHTSRCPLCGPRPHHRRTNGKHAMQ